MFTASKYFILSCLCKETFTTEIKSRSSVYFLCIHACNNKQLFKRHSAIEDNRSHLRAENDLSEQNWAQTPFCPLYFSATVLVVV